MSRKKTRRADDETESSRARSDATNAVPKPGRPTRCTPEVVDRLVKLVKIGVPTAVACRTEGLGKATMHRWRVEAAAGVEPYASLIAQLQVAQSQAAAQITMQLVKASQRDWKAAAWWLERRVPAHFAAKQSVRVQNVNTNMTDAELDEAMAKHGYVRAVDTVEPDDE